MSTLRDPRDGDLAMVTPRRLRGQFDRQPVLARFHVAYEPEDGDTGLAFWEYFGTEHTTYPRDTDIHYYVTLSRLVGYAAL